MSNSKRPQSRKGAGRPTASRPTSASKGARPATRPRQGATRPAGWSAADQSRRDQQRQKLLFAGVGIGVVIVLVVVLVLVKTIGGGSSNEPKVTASQSSTAISKATSVPASALNAIKADGYTYKKGQVGLQQVTGTPVKVGDKPTVVYLGAEFCPYCAAQRWPLVVALSRFGKFSGLATTSSAGSPEPHPNTPTFTFLKAKYTSDYIDFQSRELSDRDHNALQSPTTQQTDLMQKYDPSTNIPFVYYAGKYYSVGASLDQDPLDGHSLSQIASALKDPSSPIARSIGGTANVMTAAICDATGGKPGNVCTASGVTAAAKKLPGSADVTP